MPPSSPSAQSASGKNRVDFVLLDLPNSMEEVQVQEKEAVPVLPLPSITYTDYVKRRINHWNNGCVDGELLDVSTELPLACQVAFRRKLLLMFALQLFGVWLTVGLATFYPPVRDRLIPVFVKYTPALAIICGVATIVFLGLLYYQRTRRFVNILILLTFSGAQAATFISLGVAFDTHLGFFNCGATFAWALLMVLLVGVRLKDDSEEGSPIPKRYLISPLIAGALSFLVVVCASCVLLRIYGQQFITGPSFGYSLLFQLFMLTWFSWDTTCMFEVVAVNEFACGVIYLYTDIVLIVAASFALVLVLLLGELGTSWTCCCDSWACCWDFWNCFWGYWDYCWIWFWRCWECQVCCACITDSCSRIYKRITRRATRRDQQRHHQHCVVLEPMERV